LENDSNSSRLEEEDENLPQDKNKNKIKEIPSNINQENKIEQYRKIKNLGRGAYGEVELYQHIETGKEYALKFVHKKTILQEGKFQAVKREK